MSIIDIKSIVDDFDNSVFQNRQNRVLFNTMDRVQYFLEYNTLNLGLPRRVGKTEFVKTNAKPWDLIVVQGYCNIQSFSDCKCDVITIGLLTEMASDYGRKPQIPRTIYFDEICYNRYPKEIIEIYRRYAQDLEQRFVFLNTPMR